MAPSETSVVWPNQIIYVPISAWGGDEEREHELKSKTTGRSNFKRS
jgi:hypothetical protein